MPIFNNEFTFIHIPKSGGTTIERFFQSKGYKMSLFNETGSIFINGHSPQHCTYRELAELNLLTDKIFTINRNEIDRCISEYRYILNARPDLAKLFNTFDEFLDLFLDRKNALVFDNHNLSNREFLIDMEGKINKKIKIFDFFNVKKIEKYLGLSGLSNFHELHYKSQVEVSKAQISRIKEFYKR